MADISAVRLRDAAPADIVALAELHVRTFDETHGPGPRVAVREQQWRDKFARPDLLLFCVLLEDASGSPIGFASGEPHRSDDLGQFEGELDKIYLLRKYHGFGYGRRLLCAAARRFVERGIRSMLLFGDAASATNGFYERMGGERLLAATGEFHGSYGWRDLRPLVEKCPEDE